MSACFGAHRAGVLFAAENLLGVGQVNVLVAVLVPREAAVVADLLVADLVVVAEVAGARLVAAVETEVTRVADAETVVAIPVARAIVVAVVDVVPASERKGGRDVLVWRARTTKSEILR